MVKYEKDKKIIHIDMDYFFAAIEIRNNPALSNKPIAIGGTVEERGVLSTCNYVARKYGLHSAMPTYTALKKCKDLVLLPVNMPLYEHVSQEIHIILQEYTDLIEPMSLDEAYLDVTDSNKYSNSATLIAQEIQQRIFKNLKLTASAGVAPLKFLAKIASDYNKPNGIFTISPKLVDQFITKLALNKLPGVGNVTFNKLKAMNLLTCEDIRKVDLPFLMNIFGKCGLMIWQYSHGIDNRAIATKTTIKSVGVEKTLPKDINDIHNARQIILQLYKKLILRLENKLPIDKNFYGIRLGLKLKFNDFQQTTIERTKQQISQDNFIELLNNIWERRHNRQIRLIGIHVQIPKPQTTKQLSLF